MDKKWNLQDIRPSKSVSPNVQKSVRPVSRQAPDIRQRPQRDPEEQRSFDDSDLGSIQIVDGNSAKRKKFLITAVIGLFIILAGIGLNLLLGGADITIYPKMREVSVQANFKAFSTPQADELSFELLTLEATGERSVRATGKEQASERATGRIFVYNTASESTQRLIKNTRFENEDGLIFRIQESIEVPGVKYDEEGKVIPGSVVAEVFADGTGDQYNLKPTRFTVPGLKGTAQYETIYAESTSAFTGGFEGEKFIIDEAEFSTQKQSLELELRDKLLSRLNEEKPAGFILYQDAVTFTYDQLPSTDQGDSSALIKERARLQVPIFKESEFASYIAEQTIPDYRSDPVVLENPFNLTFSYTDPTQELSDISAAETLEFTLTGTVDVVWVFDEEKVKQDLLGKKKTETANIFKNYPSISNVKAEVRPFWTSNFPDNPEEIHIEKILLEKE